MERDLEGQTNQMMMVWKVIVMMMVTGEIYTALYVKHYF